LSFSCYTIAYLAHTATEIIDNHSLKETRIQLLALRLIDSESEAVVAGATVSGFENEQLRGDGL
jgi:hypothetical protein